jgi:hypothetical protein
MVLQGQQGIQDASGSILKRDLEKARRIILDKRGFNGKVAAGGYHHLLGISPGL